MKIIITETRSNEVLIFKIKNESLFIDDLEVDFSQLKAGEEIIPNAKTPKEILGGSRDLDGNLTIKLLFPYNPQSFPEGYTLMEEIEIVEGIVNPFKKVENVVWYKNKRRERARRVGKN